MGIDKVIKLVDVPQELHALTIVMIALLATSLVFGVIMLFVSEKHEIAGALIVFPLAFGIIPYTYEDHFEVKKDNVVYDYITKLEEKNDRISDFNKNEITISDVVTKKDKMFVTVNVNKNGKVIKSKKVAIVSDLKDGSVPYINYKEVSKDIPGYYKKGWLNASIHVEEGTSPTDVLDHVYSFVGKVYN